MHSTYHLRNLQCLTAPGSTAIVRRLRGEQDPAYVFERDRHPVRTHRNVDGVSKEEPAGGIHG